MSSNFGPESAKIIPLPLKTRGFGPKASSPSKTPSAQKPFIQWGGSWYHQSAIDEAARDRKS